VISVTHRLSTTRNADTIIVLDDGKIVETGTYKHVIEDLGNVLDTHEALHEFQRKLSNRSVRKLSSDRRHLSRGASQSGSGLANLSAARDSHEERDSYLVL
ncbi:hypothetical protein DYB37_011646, partial [Aphanomyces astaci]